MRTDVDHETPEFSDLRCQIPGLTVDAQIDLRLRLIDQSELSPKTRA